MALGFGNTSASLNWQQNQVNTPFQPTTQGADSVALSVSLNNAEAVFAKEYAIAASGSQSIDLTNITDLLNLTYPLVAVYAIIVKCTGADCIFSPGATNGLQWFFGGATNSITVKKDGCFLYSSPSSTPVTSTSKTLLLTNASSTDALSVTIAIIGDK